ncbi:MAG TPA: regulatory signaling modulator protein AmpE [Spongiibacteraceae bacterium]|nr:regulatory signaling modulator protein AmpE [Spongiibacteraceae bacterium]
MEFVVILIAWVLLHYIEVPASLQRDEWLVAWRLRAGTALSALSDTARVLLICALPCALIAAIEWLLAPRWAGIPLFALEMVVLLYSLGRGEFRAQLNAYLDCWQRGDYEAAYQEASRVFQLDSTLPLSSADELHVQVRRGILYMAFERWFVVVFWFYFLGPWAALFYRLLHLTLAQHSTESERALIREWLQWIEWLPARILGLAFSITGNFVACFGVWREYLASFTAIPQLLAAYTEHALMGMVADSTSDGDQFPERAVLELRELDALLARSAIAWLVMFALLQMLR